MDLLLAGDFFAPGPDFPRVGDELRTLLDGALHSFVNVEGPITGSTHRITKTGPAIASGREAAWHLKDAGFSGAVLANNHILDAGVAGAAETIGRLEEAGLAHVGLKDVDLPTYADLVARDGSRLRILAFCEREWSVRPQGLSAVPWSLTTSIRLVQQARQEGALPVVVLHGGNEYFPLPRPQLRDDLRLLADLGAAAIVMHHSHVASAYEVWNGVPISYGLGNFQFAMSSAHHGWHEGLVACLGVSGGGLELELVPIAIDKTFAVEVTSGHRRRAILNQIEGHRLQVTSDAALSAQWQQFARETALPLLAVAQPSSSSLPGLLRRIRTKMREGRLRRHPAESLVLANVLRCDSLRDLSATALSNHVDEVIRW